MDTVIILIIAFMSVFVFAFGMAWFLPLLAAHSEQKKNSETIKQADIYLVLDMLMVFLDCIPLFWLFRAIPEGPNAYRAARLKWKSEPSIRWSFRAFLVCLVLLIGAVLYPLNT